MGKVILFDFFGVISSEVSPIWFKRYFNEVEALEIKEEIMSKGDKGELNEEEVYELIASKMNMSPLKIKEDFDELISRSNRLTTYAFTPLKSLISEDAVGKPTLLASLIQKFSLYIMSSKYGF